MPVGSTWYKLCVPSPGSEKMNTYKYVSIYEPSRYELMRAKGEHNRKKNIKPIGEKGGVIQVEA